MMRKSNEIEDKLGYLLLLITVVQFAYPITQYGTLWLVAFQFLYVSMILVGIFIARDNRLSLTITVVSGIAYLLAGIWYSFDPTDNIRILLAYIAVTPYQATLLFILLRYILQTKVVNRDVVYAAAAVYLLIGALFVGVFGVIETLQPGSIIDGSVASGELLGWQNIIYFSYVTLTTAGYGDVLPVTWWARSVATLESVMGVLYLAVIMARLVGLYAVEAEQEAEQEAEGLMH